jgi:hypothetical protein
MAERGDQQQVRLWHESVAPAAGRWSLGTVGQSRLKFFLQKDFQIGFKNLGAPSSLRAPSAAQAL